MSHSESVLTALQVLELREQLEGKGDDSNNVDMEDEEKALLREMCNVRKQIINVIMYRKYKFIIWYCLGGMAKTGRCSISCK